MSCLIRNGFNVLSAQQGFVVVLLMGVICPGGCNMFCGTLVFLQSFACAEKDVWKGQGHFYDWRHLV